MQDFSVEGVHKMFGGSDFSRVERNFTIGQSPKICIKINRKLKEIWENWRKCKFFRIFFNFLAGHKFLIMGKINNLIWTCCNGGFGGGAPPEGRKNFRKFVEIGNVKFNNLTKIAWIFCTGLDKNIRIIENFIRPGGSGVGAPRG